MGGLCWHLLCGAVNAAANFTERVNIQHDNFSSGDSAFLAHQLQSGRLPYRQTGQQPHRRCKHSSWHMMQQNPNSSPFGVRVPGITSTSSFSAMMTS